jgi:methyl-accepting chemotaxis protein
VPDTDTVVERNLEEEVYRLQKLGLAPDMREVIDEAARVLGEGRHIEAAALLEKAEAMRRAAESLPKATEAAALASGPAPGPGADIALASTIDKLAYGLACTLTMAVRDLEAHIAAEARKVGDALGQRLEVLQAGMEHLAVLKPKLDDLNQAIAEQRHAGLLVEEKCQQLTDLTASLQETDARHEAELGALRSETRETSLTISGRIDSLSGELGVQQQSIGEVRSALTDVSVRTDSLVERLDGQAEAIRSLYANSAQREAALDQLMEALTRLKSSRGQAPAGDL